MTDPAKMTVEELNAAVSLLQGWVGPTDPLMREWHKIRAHIHGAAKLEPGDEVWLERRDLDARFWIGPGNFCKSWASAGPILEREGITVERIDSGDGTYTFRCPHYDVRQRDKTYLIAAMRAYVAKSAQ